MGAGNRLLAYDLSKPNRIWEDVTWIGFWGWKQHGDVVLMSAETELAAWRTNGEKLWSTEVEPPWYYSIKNGHVELEVNAYPELGELGEKSTFNLFKGPKF